jgi:hypothetical protein
MPRDWLGIERLDDCEEPDATEYSEYWELRFELEVVEAFHVRSQRRTRGRHHQKSIPDQYLDIPINFGQLNNLKEKTVVVVGCMLTDGKCFQPTHIGNCEPPPSRGFDQWKI